LLLLCVARLKDELVPSVFFIPPSEVDNFFIFFILYPAKKE
jgi:hypothetical protein